jgi:quercetin dioxygenase-like cupin family protein
MTTRWVAFGAGLATLLLAAAHRERPAQGQSPAQGEILTVRNQFDAVLSYRTAAGETRRVRVARRQWSLTGRSTLPRSPEPGLLVVQLTGGDATVTIGKEHRTLRGDEFWTVPAGTPMRIDVGKEQATLEVLAIGEP